MTTEPEVTTTFRVGDRVRRKNRVRVREMGIAGYLPGIGTIFEVAEAEGYYHVSPWRGALRWTSGDDLELVERAWYAPPGVPMMALTPEVLAAIEASIEVFLAFDNGDDEQLVIDREYARILSEAIAAAQKGARR